jgi:hypothetical protein
MGGSWEVRPRGLHRLLAPVIARMGQRQEQASWASLKRFLEEQQDLIPDTT